jgi:hypothetical protein
VESLKTRGLLKWASGSPPPRVRAPDIYERNGPAGLTKICMNVLVEGLHCKFGRQCNSKHITGMRDFSPENKPKFTSFVTDHANLEMANPGTNLRRTAPPFFIAINLASKKPYI